MLVYQLLLMVAFFHMKMFKNAWHKLRLMELWVLNLFSKTQLCFLEKFMILMMLLLIIYNWPKNIRVLLIPVSEVIYSKYFILDYKSTQTSDNVWQKQEQMIFSVLCRNSNKGDLELSQRTNLAGILGIGKIHKLSRMELRYKKLKKMAK